MISLNLQVTTFCPSSQKKKLQSSVWRVVLLCQFLVMAGNRQFFCCGGKVLLWPEKKFKSSVWRVVLLCQFLVLAITTGKKVPVVCLAGCAVVSVFGSGGKLAVLLLWRESFITTGKKSSSCLSGGLCCCVNFGSDDYGRKKKVPVVCLAGCAVVSVFGSGDYDWKKKF